MTPHNITFSILYRWFLGRLSTTKYSTPTEYFVLVNGWNQSVFTESSKLPGYFKKFKYLSELKSRHIAPSCISAKISSGTSSLLFHQWSQTVKIFGYDTKSVIATLRLWYGYVFRGTYKPSIILPWITMFTANVRVSYVYRTCILCVGRYMHFFAFGELG